MKFILAMVLVFGLPCGAEVLGTAKNVHGGDMVLTDEVSQCGGTTRKIITKDKDGKVQVEGCWKQIPDEDRIMVYWPEVGIYFYGRSEFKNRKMRWL